MEKKLWKIETEWEKAIHIAKQKKDSPALLESEYFEILDEYRPRTSDVPVHHDDNGDYFGLADSILLYRGKPIFIVDNHNKALFAFHEIKKGFEKVLPVINIDAHPDDKVVGFGVDEIRKENIQDIYNKTRISDFFDVAKKGKLIRSVSNIVKSIEFMGFTVPEDEYILSLDIDIFGQEGDYVDLERRVKVIASAWNGASAVVIATSPGFIEQEYANEIIKIFCKRTMI